MRAQRRRWPCCRPEIDKLTEKIAKATARGDAKAAAKAQESIDTYATWLAQARATLADFNR